MPYIKTRITAIENIPVIEQKTPEWFKMRESMISASDAGYFLNKCGLSKAIDALKIKIGLKHYTNSNAPPLMHGNTYEDVFYTGTTLTDVPTESVWVDALEGILSGITGVGSYVINPTTNSVVVKSYCDGTENTLSESEFIVGLKINFNIFCQT